jgi:histone acetyltransferase
MSQKVEQNKNEATESTTNPSLSRQNSIEKINLRKQRVYALPKSQKMARLGMYSACQIKDCRCNGWKIPQENRHREIDASYCPKFTDECRHSECKHSLEMHVSHLGDITDDQINELLGATVDVENLYTSMYRDHDPETKKVYWYLFRVSQTLFAFCLANQYIFFFNFSCYANVL